MISKTVLDEMNNQIKYEFFSAYLYLSMAAHCESMNLPGFGKWMRVQAREELGHGMKFFEYIHDAGEQVVLQEIEQPPAKFESPFKIFEHTLEHEKKVTARIEHIYALALQEKDYASQVFLQWFLTEQVEEEKNAKQILETLDMVGESGSGLIMLDHQLGQRGG